MKTVTITKKKFSQKACTVFVLSMLEKTLKQYAPPFTLKMKHGLKVHHDCQNKNSKISAKLYMNIFIYKPCV